MNNSNELSKPFIIVDWSLNKLYTVFENSKQVKVGDKVTCFVNHTKDIGIVKFAGNTSSKIFNFLEYMF